MRANEYYIPSYVHFAFEGDSAVFMDLRSDEYSMLVGEQGRAFKAMLRAGPDRYRCAISQDDAAAADAEVYRNTLAELLEHGLLTTNTSLATCHSLTPIAFPKTAILYALSPELTRMSMRDVWRFIASCVTAKWRLSFMSIESTVRSVELRKMSHKNCASSRLNLVEARRVVGIYNRLRPLIPQDFMCLFDSLSLLGFLAKYQCFPSWVFAVRLEPWAAHCWVQHGAIAFNQDVDEAKMYLPLMAV